VKGERGRRLHCPLSPRCWVTFADDDALEREVTDHMSRAHGVAVNQHRIDDVLADLEEVRR
jgi:predicted small metal-binding protein